MKQSSYRARTHLFVCANRRAEDDPLGTGCGERGERVFAALKTSTRPLVSSVWVTKTHCLGLCPKRGCTVAIAPAMEYLVDVEETDVPAIVAALSAAR